MTHAHWIRHTALRALTLSLVLTLTSCSLLSPRDEVIGAVPSASTSAPADTAGVEVEFPGRDDLQATTEPVEQPTEMTEVLPAGATLHDAVDITLVNGEFPDTGATVSFNIDEELPEGASPLVVHWNEGTAEWEPLASELSEDGKTLSADVEHFSTYSWIDIGFNTINDLTGNFADPPECPLIEPLWSDVEYVDHLNNPLLWCAGTDEDNGDILEVRVVGNRATATFLDTAVEPEWVKDDFDSSTSPDAWGKLWMGLDPVNASMTNRYLLTPGGELQFRFAKDKLFEFRKNSESSSVLIQGATSPSTILGGILYDTLVDGAESVGKKGTTKEEKALGYAAIGIVLSECKYKIDAAEEEPTHTAVSTALLECWEARADDITEKIVDLYVGMENIGLDEAEARSKVLRKKLGFIAIAYGIAKNELVWASVVGDANLPASALQLHFIPSAQGVRDQAEGYTTVEELCAECTVTGEETITHPEWGSVTLKTLLPNEGLPAPGYITVVNTTGNVMWSVKTAPVTKLLPTGTVQDSTSNVFLNYNSGRYNGVTVLHPTTEGFDDLKTLPTEMHDSRFYYSVTEAGNDGKVSVWTHSCDPRCAGGTLTKQEYQWDGSDYVAVGPAQDGNDWPDELYSSEP